jgi:RNA polymerase subunit RPABC4/transcription elongation factor Spt4
MKKCDECIIGHHYDYEEGYLIITDAEVTVKSLVDVPYNVCPVCTNEINWSKIECKNIGL